MEFTVGKYRARNGTVIDIYYRHHGVFLAGRPIKGHPEWKSPRWALSHMRAPYIADEAHFETFLGKRLDRGFDLVEKLVE